MRYLVIALLILPLLLVSCQNKSNGTKEIPEIVSISDSKIQLNNGKAIDYFTGAEGDETILFVVRNGAHKKNKFDQEILTSEGEARSSHLAKMLESVELSGTLAGLSNVANETARPTADKKGLKVLNYDHVDYGAFLDYIYSLEKGKKYLVVGFAETIPDLLNLITAGKKFDAIPLGVYDDFFVVKTKNRGNANIYHLKMNFGD